MTRTVELALAGEQLARGVLDERAEHEESEKPHGMPYSKLVMTLGERLPWLAPFEKLISTGQTSDKQGTLDQLAVRLAEAAHAVGAERNDIIANTLAAAVATRNLVRHRHLLLSSREAKRSPGRVPTP